MGKKLAISIFIVVAVASSSAIGKSLHFPVAAPPAAAAGADDLRTAIKANGMPPIGSSSIDLIASPADTPEAVTNKAAVAQCEAVFATAGLTCTVTNDSDPGNPCSAAGGVVCCARFTSITNDPVNVTCNRGPGTQGFTLRRIAQTPVPPNPEDAREISATGTLGGSVTHYGAENKNVYPDVGSDPFQGTLIQARPNGSTGTITISIYHTQGGANPRTATVTVNASNNDPGEALALHNAIETALEAIAPALPVPIIATTRTQAQATAPLTAFGWFKQATHFVEVQNMAAAQVQEVRIAAPLSPTAAGITIEGTDRVTDLVAGVPTLNEWGIIALVLVLMFCGYILIRRQRARLAAV